MKWILWNPSNKNPGSSSVRQINTAKAYYLIHPATVSGLEKFWYFFLSLKGLKSTSIAIPDHNWRESIPDLM